MPVDPCRGNASLYRAFVPDLRCVRSFVFELQDNALPLVETYSFYIEHSTHQWVIFHGIMQRPNARLRDPVDPDDINHRVTNAVKNQLISLETHFSKCEAIVKDEMSRLHHGVLFTITSIIEAMTNTHLNRKL